MRKNLKKLMAVTLTVTMTMASAMVVSAADELTGDGSFEGTELKNPPIAVSLPTTANIDYIADPNLLIENTKDATGDALRDDYKGIDFDGRTGIYFPNTTSGDAVVKYSNESQTLKAYNKSRQAIKFTVKMQADEGNESITYASGDAFSSGDAARKVYFEISDGTSGDAIKGTGAAGAATFQTEVQGTPNNFETAYEGDEYKYVQTAEATASGDAAWQCAQYKLKGAANTNGKWGSDKTLEFPQIKVTWTYADAAGPFVSDVTIAQGDKAALDIPVDLGTGASAISDVVVTYNNALYSKYGAWSSSTDMASHITIANNKITLAGAWLEYFPAGTYPICIVYDNDDSKTSLINLVVE